VKIFHEKGKEKVLDRKNFGVRSRCSVGLKAMEAVKLAEYFYQRE